MDFFKIVPENLFSLLSSKNKDIYLEGLFVIRKAYKQEMLIKRDDMAIMLIANLENRMMNLDDEDYSGERNLSSAAYFLLRRFEETGWIEKEDITNSFDVYINIPDYSIKILNALYEIIDITPREYNSYVYSTYSLLKTSNEEKNGYIFNALRKAYDNTHELLDELKSLLNNIRRYHSMLSDQSQVKGILQEHFNGFKELIDDKIYHPLKTFDSVPRFKTPIINILKSWMYDNEVINLMIDSAMLRNTYEDKEKVRDDIISMMGEIIDIYERIDSLLIEIDRKKAAYTRASVEKLQYLLNTDRSIKGKIIEILKRVSEDSDEELINELQTSINAFPQKFIDEYSLYYRAKRKFKIKSEPMALNKKIDEEALLKELDDFKERVRNTFSHKRVMDFMKLKFGDKQELLSSEIEIKDDEEFIMLILGALKYDETGSFYNLQYQNNYEYRNGYRIPDMIFTKKVK